MPRDIELLTEIRDLLQVVAEPALAKRDEKFRNALRELAGKGKKSGIAITRLSCGWNNDYLLKVLQA